MRPYMPSVMPMTMANVAVLIAFLHFSIFFSTLSATKKSSSGKRLGNFCQALVPTSVLSSSSSANVTLPRSYYFCHPKKLNGVVKCVVGWPSGDKRDHVAKVGTDVLSLDTNVTATATQSNATDASKANLVESAESMLKTAVVDEREFICRPGLFFSTLLKECTISLASDCAGFSRQPSSHELLQRLEHRERQKRKWLAALAALNALDAVINRARGEVNERKTKTRWSAGQIVGTVIGVIILGLLVFCGGSMLVMM